MKPTGEVYTLCAFAERNPTVVMKATIGRKRKPLA
jgi:hypothetical protein